MVHSMTLLVPYQSEVMALAKRVAAIEPRDHSGIALLGLVTGVLYALNRAIELGFDDARMKKRGIDDERTEIHRTLEAIGHDHRLSDAWLAGFYLVSAVMRLDTFYQRIADYAGEKKILAHKVYCTNRAIKHDIDAGLRKGWEIQFADVLRSTKDVCELLEKVLS